MTKSYSQKSGARNDLEEEKAPPSSPAASMTEFTPCQLEIEPSSPQKMSRKAALASGLVDTRNKYDIMVVRCSRKERTSLKSHYLCLH